MRPYRFGAMRESLAKFVFLQLFARDMLGHTLLQAIAPRVQLTRCYHSPKRGRIDTRPHAIKAGTARLGRHSKGRASSRTAGQSPYLERLIPSLRFPLESPSGLDEPRIRPVGLRSAICIRPFGWRRSER